MVTAIAILYIGYNYLKGIDFFENTKKYYAKYSNVGGLTVSNPVTISGYSVGRVSDVKIIQSDSNKVVIELDINGDIVLGEGAIAILDIGLLGDTQILIEAGDINKPLAPLDTLNSRLGTGITAVLEENISGLSTNLQTTIARINAILDKFTGSGDQINNMVDNLEQTTLNARRMSLELRRNLNEVTEGYKVTVENLNSKIDNMDPLLAKYGELADSLKAINVQPTLDSAALLLSDIRVLMARLNESEGTLQKLMEDPTLYDNLNKSLVSLDSLLIHMRSRPKDFFKPLGRDKPKGVRK